MKASSNIDLFYLTGLNQTDEERKAKGLGVWLDFFGSLFRTKTTTETEMDKLEEEDQDLRSDVAVVVALTNSIVRKLAESAYLYWNEDVRAAVTMVAAARSLSGQEDLEPSRRVALDLVANLIQSGSLSLRVLTGDGHALKNMLIDLQQLTVVDQDRTLAERLVNILNSQQQQEEVNVPGDQARIDEENVMLQTLASRSVARSRMVVSELGVLLTNLREKDSPEAILLNSVSELRNGESQFKLINEMAVNAFAFSKDRFDRHSATALVQAIVSAFAQRLVKEKPEEEVTAISEAFNACTRSNSLVSSWCGRFLFLSAQVFYQSKRSECLNIFAQVDDDEEEVDIFKKPSLLFSNQVDGDFQKAQALVRRTTIAQINVLLDLLNDLKRGVDPEINFPTSKEQLVAPLKRASNRLRKIAEPLIEATRAAAREFKLSKNPFESEGVVVPTGSVSLVQFHTEDGRTSNVLERYSTALARPFYYAMSAADYEVATSEVANSKLLQNERSKLTWVQYYLNRGVLGASKKAEQEILSHLVSAGKNVSFSTSSQLLARFVNGDTRLSPSMQTAGARLFVTEATAYEMERCNTFLNSLLLAYNPGTDLGSYLRPLFGNKLSLLSTFASHFGLYYLAQQGIFQIMPMLGLPELVQPVYMPVLCDFDQCFEIRQSLQTSLSPLAQALSLPAAQALIGTTYLWLAASVDKFAALPKNFYQRSAIQVINSLLSSSVVTIMLSAGSLATTDNNYHAMFIFGLSTIGAGLSGHLTYVDFLLAGSQAQRLLAPYFGSMLQQAVEQVETSSSIRATLNMTTVSGLSYNPLFPTSALSNYKPLALQKAWIDRIGDLLPPSFLNILKLTGCGILSVANFYMLVSTTLNFARIAADSGQAIFWPGSVLNLLSFDARSYPAPDDSKALLAASAVASGEEGREVLEQFGETFKKLSAQFPGVSADILAVRALSLIGGNGTEINTEWPSTRLDMSDQSREALSSLAQYAGTERPELANLDRAVFSAMALIVNQIQQQLAAGSSVSPTFVSYSDALADMVNLGMVLQRWRNPLTGRSEASSLLRVSLDDLLQFPRGNNATLISEVPSPATALTLLSERQSWSDRLGKCLLRASKDPLVELTINQANSLPLGGSQKDRVKELSRMVYASQKGLADAECLLASAKEQSSMISPNPDLELLDAMVRGLRSVNTVLREDAAVPTRSGLVRIFDVFASMVSYSALMKEGPSELGRRLKYMVSRLFILKEPDEEVLIKALQQSTGQIPDTATLSKLYADLPKPAGSWLEQKVVNGSSAAAIMTGEDLKRMALASEFKESLGRFPKTISKLLKPDPLEGSDSARRFFALVYASSFMSRGVAFGLAPGGKPPGPLVDGILFPNVEQLVESVKLEGPLKPDYKEALMQMYFGVGILPESKVQVLYPYAAPSVSDFASRINLSWDLVRRMRNSSQMQQFAEFLRKVAVDRQASSAPTLREYYEQIKRNDTALSDVFPPEMVTGADLRQEDALAQADEVADRINVVRREGAFVAASGALVAYFGSSLPVSWWQAAALIAPSTIFLSGLLRSAPTFSNALVALLRPAANLLIQQAVSVSYDLVVAGLGLLYEPQVVSAFQLIDRDTLVRRISDWFRGQFGQLFDRDLDNMLFDMGAERPVPKIPDFDTPPPGKTKAAVVDSNMSTGMRRIVQACESEKDLLLGDELRRSAIAPVPPMPTSESECLFERPPALEEWLRRVKESKLSSLTQYVRNLDLIQLYEQQIERLRPPPEADPTRVLLENRRATQILSGQVMQEMVDCERRFLSSLHGSDRRLLSFRNAGGEYRELLAFRSDRSLKKTGEDGTVEMDEPATDCERRFVVAHVMRRFDASLRLWWSDRVLRFGTDSTDPERLLQSFPVPLSVLYQATALMMCVEVVAPVEDLKKIGDELSASGILQHFWATVRGSYEGVRASVQLPLLWAAYAERVLSCMPDALLMLGVMAAIDMPDQLDSVAQRFGGCSSSMAQPWRYTFEPSVCEEALSDPMHPFAHELRRSCRAAAELKEFRTVAQDCTLEAVVADERDTLPEVAWRVRGVQDDRGRHYAVVRIPLLSMEKRGAIDRIEALLGGEFMHPTDLHVRNECERVLKNLEDLPGLDLSWQELQRDA